MQYHKNADMIRFYPVIQQNSIWISYSNKAPFYPYVPYPFLKSHKLSANVRELHLTKVKMLVVNIRQNV